MITGSVGGQIRSAAANAFPRAPRWKPWDVANSSLAQNGLCAGKLAIVFIYLLYFLRYTCDLGTLLLHQKLNMSDKDSRLRLNGRSRSNFVGTRGLDV